jgi:hypothetical protein
MCGFPISDVPGGLTRRFESFDIPSSYTSVFPVAVLCSSFQFFSINKIIKDDHEGHQYGTCLVFWGQCNRESSTLWASWLILSQVFWVTQPPQDLCLLHKIDILSSNKPEVQIWYTKFNRFRACFRVCKMGKEQQKDHSHQNGTLDRGLDTEHGSVCVLRTIEPTLSSSSLIWIQISFFHKNQRYRNSSLLFLILK